MVAPQRFADAFGEGKIGFIAGNKFGFTDKDGKNLKDLFERMVGKEARPERVQQMFTPQEREMIKGKYVKGVFFLNSQLIPQLLPGFEKKMREWQFINATIDLIRGEERSNKKERYIQEVNEYFQTQKFAILQQLINQRAEIPSKNYLQLYLSNVSTGFQAFLQKNQLNTRYTPEYLYARDVNEANNKSDQFMHKTLELFDEEGNLLTSTQEDILEIASLTTTGKRYRLQVSYDFALEDKYVKEIHHWEKKYQIQLTPREEHILVLKPLPDYGQGVLPQWASRGMIYFPPQVEIGKLAGDATTSGTFSPEFSKGVWYRISTQNPYANLHQSIRFKI